MFSVIMGEGVERGEKGRTGENLDWISISRLTVGDTEALGGVGMHCFQNN